MGYSQWFTVTFEPATSFGPYCTALFRNPPDFTLCQNTKLRSTLWGVKNLILANLVYSVVKSGKQPFTFIHAAGASKGTKRSADPVLEPLLGGADDS